MNFFDACFLILVTQISIFSTECFKKNSFINNEQEEIHSKASIISELDEHKHNEFNSLKEIDSLNISNLQERSNNSKFQFNRAQSISVQPQNVTFTFLLSKLMRMKRELIKRRLNNNSVNRIKNVKQSTNAVFRDDTENEATNPSESNKENTEINPADESEDKNTVNNEENSETDEPNKNEENVATQSTTQSSSDSKEEEQEEDDEEEKVDSSLQQIEPDQDKLNNLIEKVKKLLSTSGDYIMSVVLRILKESIRKYKLGKKFLDKVKKLAQEYQGNILQAQKELEKKLGKKFGKKFRFMLIKLLTILATNVKVKQ